MPDSRRDRIPIDRDVKDSVSHRLERDRTRNKPDVERKTDKSYPKRDRETDVKQRHHVSDRYRASEHDRHSRTSRHSRHRRSPERDRSPDAEGYRPSPSSKHHRASSSHHSLKDSASPGRTRSSRSKQEDESHHRSPSSRERDSGKRHSKPDSIKPCRVRKSRSSSPLVDLREKLQRHHKHERARDKHEEGKRDSRSYSRPEHDVPTTRRSTRATRERTRGEGRNERSPHRVKSQYHEHKSHKKLSKEKENEEQGSRKGSDNESMDIADHHKPHSVPTSSSLSNRLLRISLQDNVDEDNSSFSKKRHDTVGHRKFDKDVDRDRGKLEISLSKTIDTEGLGQMKNRRECALQIQNNNVEGYQEVLERHVNQMFIRGDNVVLIGLAD